jgi:hypothetical protein
VGYVDEYLMHEFVNDLKNDSFVVVVDFDLMVMNNIQDFLSI